MAIPKYSLITNSWISSAGPEGALWLPNPSVLVNILNIFSYHCIRQDAVSAAVLYVLPGSFRHLPDSAPADSRISSADPDGILQIRQFP